MVAAVGVDVQTVLDIDPGEPTNMESFCAYELTQAAPQSDWLKDVAPSNMRLIETTRDTSHREISALNDVAFPNIFSMVLTRDTSHFEMSALNECALENAEYIEVTRDTSHFEMSALNDFAP